MSDDERERLGRIVREAWVAYARDHPTPCYVCGQRGTILPACRRCADSTEDHECPGPETCRACGGRGAVVKPAHVAPWEDLSEDDREADRRIGEAVRAAVDAEWLAAARAVRRGWLWWDGDELAGRDPDLAPLAALVDRALAAEGQLRPRGRPDADLVLAEPSRVWATLTDAGDGACVLTLETLVAPGCPYGLAEAELAGAEAAILGARLVTGGLTRRPVLTTEARGMLRDARDAIDRALAAGGGR